MPDFLAHTSKWQNQAIPQYEIYPPKLKEPYRTSRFELGEQMYDVLNITREMKDERIAQVMKNFEFFGAPSALFCYVDKQMGPPQWSDLGMFLQTFMLLAQESGLSTCAQEAWSIKHDCVSSFLNIQNEDILFCGMAIGYEDKSHPLSKFVSERRSIDDWITFV
jgi:nitroreductase